MPRFRRRRSSAPASPAHRSRTRWRRTPRCCCWSARRSPAMHSTGRRPRCSWRATARRRCARSRAPAARFYEHAAGGLRRRTAPRRRAARSTLATPRPRGRCCDALLATLGASRPRGSRCSTPTRCLSRVPVLRRELVHRRACSRSTRWTSTCTRCTRASCAARAAPAARCGPMPQLAARGQSRAAAGRSRWPTAAVSARRTLVNAAGAWADDVARALRRGADRPPAQAAQRLHLRARRGHRRPPPGRRCRRRRELVLQARRRPAARLAGQRRPGARRTTWCPKSSTSPWASHQIEAHHHADHPPPDAHLGRPALLRARRRSGDRLGRAAARASSGSRPRRLRHPERRRRGAAGRRALARRAAAATRCSGKACRCTPWSPVGAGPLPSRPTPSGDSSRASVGANDPALRCRPIRGEPSHETSCSRCRGDQRRPAVGPRRFDRAGRLPQPADQADRRLRARRLDRHRRAHRGAEAGRAARPERGRGEQGRRRRHDRCRCHREVAAPTATRSRSARPARTRSPPARTRSCPTTRSRTSRRSRWWRSRLICWWSIRRCRRAT